MYALGQVTPEIKTGIYIAPCVVRVTYMYIVDTRIHKRTSPLFCGRQYLSKLQSPSIANSEVEARVKGSTLFRRLWILNALQ